MNKDLAKLTEQLEGTRQGRGLRTPRSKKNLRNGMGYLRGNLHRKKFVTKFFFEARKISFKAFILLSSTYSAEALLRRGRQECEDLIKLLQQHEGDLTSSEDLSSLAAECSAIESPTFPHTASLNVDIGPPSLTDVKDIKTYLSRLSRFRDRQVLELIQSLEWSSISCVSEDVEHVWITSCGVHPVLVDVSDCWRPHPPSTLQVLTNCIENIQCDGVVAYGRNGSPIDKLMAFATRCLPTPDPKNTAVVLDIPWKGEQTVQLPEKIQGRFYKNPDLSVRCNSATKGHMVSLHIDEGEEVGRAFGSTVCSWRDIGLSTYNRWCSKAVVVVSTNQIQQHPPRSHCRHEQPPWMHIAKAWIWLFSLSNVWASAALWFNDLAHDNHAQRRRVNHDWLAFARTRSVYCGVSCIAWIRWTTSWWTPSWWTPSWWNTFWSRPHHARVSRLSEMLGRDIRAASAPGNGANSNDHLAPDWWLRFKNFPVQHRRS